MRIVLFGAPGSGKGTQATLLEATLGVAHISTGDLLRREVAADTELGREAKAVMSQGRLVSDEIVLGMLERRVAQPDARAGFILDGYPRNLAQAAALEALLERLGKPLDAALYLYVGEDLLFQRLAGRANAEGRHDDHPETVRERLAVYRQQTAPLIAHFAELGQLYEIDGVGTVEEVTRRIRDTLARVPAQP